MPRVKVLVEGYARQIDCGWEASSTVCLVETSSGKKIITDPGCNRGFLLIALEENNLKTSDVDYVFLSHRHPDHVLLAGIFENAEYVTFDTDLMYKGDKMLEFNKDFFGNGVEILDTPGHTKEHLSLLVSTEKGKIVIAGDAIWWLVDEEQILDMRQKDHSNTYDMNMSDLIKSRKLLLRKADYIIPGHGKMFNVNDIQIINN